MALIVPIPGHCLLFTFDQLENDPINLWLLTRLFTYSRIPGHCLLFTFDKYENDPVNMYFLAYSRTKNHLEV